MRFRLVPTDDAFFSLFDDSAANVAECARRLRDLLSDPTDPTGHEKVAACEHRGDELVRAILQRLNTTFVTPIDREDIHELGSSMDDVLDHIDAAADLIVLHKIERPLPEMKAQAELLVKAAKTTLDAMRALPHFERLESYGVEINRLENEGDRLHRQATADLFSGDYKAMDVLKWKGIIDELEAAMDEVEDVANTLEGIALKQA